MFSGSSGREFKKTKSVESTSTLNFKVRIEVRIVPPRNNFFQ